MKLLLVDGYNVLRSGSRYRQLAAAANQPDHTHDAFNSARQTLISDVATFAGSEWRAVVVFDGGGNPSSDGQPRQVAGVEVIFSAAGKSADAVIEGLAHQAASAGEEVLVVTSDAATQWTVLGRGVTRMSAEGFCAEMGGVQREVVERAEQERLVKTTLAERLEPGTREALAKIAKIVRTPKA
ncbi:MAG: NYN domain-containing protein [Coriobacteriales bacterium]|jgi:predicted RNA-binding protein with PIN domain|nr:NYN domain-containing protein [Coriobacteriales bacterium]